MRDRLTSYLKRFYSPRTMTFHALAHALVQPDGKILFDEADPEQSRSRILQDMINRYRLRLPAS